jgi:hypothetical protein
MALIVERLGTYRVTLNAGFHFVIPLIGRMSKKISLKEAFFDYKPQPVITKDNVTMLVDSMALYQISDSKLYAYGVDNPQLVIDSLTAASRLSFTSNMNFFPLFAINPMFSTNPTTNRPIYTRISRVFVSSAIQSPASSRQIGRPSLFSYRRTSFFILSRKDFLFSSSPARNRVIWSWLIAPSVHSDNPAAVAFWYLPKSNHCINRVCPHPCFLCQLCVT